MKEVYTEIEINRLERLLHDHHEATQYLGQKRIENHAKEAMYIDSLEEVKKAIIVLVGTDLQNLEAVKVTMADRLSILKEKAEKLCNTYRGIDPFENMDELSQIVGRYERLSEVWQWINDGDVEKWIAAE